MEFSSMDQAVLQSQHIILRKDYTDTEFTVGKAILIVFMSVKNVIMFLGNTLSIITICSTPKLRNQVSYWFVLNLAIIDLLISVTVLPLNTVWEYYGLWPLSSSACQFFTYADTSFSTISAYSIVLVSIDKYIYVTYALRYYERMTHKTALIMIVSVWVLVFAFAIWLIVTDMGTEDEFRDHFLRLANGTKTCVYVLTDSYVIPTVILSFFLPLAVLCFTSTKIICVASRHLRTIHALEKSSTSGTYSQTDRIPSTAIRRRHTFSVPKAYDKALPSNSGTSTVSTECSNRDRMDRAMNNCEDLPTAKRKSLNVKSIFMIPELVQLHSQEIQSQEQFNNKSIQCFCTLSKSQQKLTNKTCDCDTSSTLTKLSSNKLLNVHRTVSAQILPRPSSIKIGRRKMRPYFKLFGTVTIVILCFILMFAPFNIAIIVDVSCHCVEPWLYEDILAVLYYMHSLVNPYIYMATDRKYKAALKLLWKRLKLKIDKIK